MNKKYYISPASTLMVLETMSMVAASKLDSTEDSQTITPTDEEYNGEFGSRRRRNVWDDEEDEED